MARSSRTKGNRGELEVVHLLHAAGFTKAARVPNSGGLHAVGRGDILGIPGTHLEIKRTERAAPFAWIEQATTDCPPLDLPVIAFRRNRSEWWGLIPFDELASLLALRSLR